MKYVKVLFRLVFLFFLTVFLYEYFHLLTWWLKEKVGSSVMADFTNVYDLAYWHASIYMFVFSVWLLFRLPYAPRRTALVSVGLWLLAASPSLVIDVIYVRDPLTRWLAEELRATASILLAHGAVLLVANLLLWWFNPRENATAQAAVTAAQ